MKAQLKCSAPRQLFVNPTTIKRKIRDVVQLVRDFGAFRGMLRVRPVFVGRSGNRTRLIRRSRPKTNNTPTMSWSFSILSSPNVWPAARHHRALAGPWRLENDKEYSRTLVVVLPPCNNPIPQRLSDVEFLHCFLDHFSCVCCKDLTENLGMPKSLAWIERLR